MAQPRSQRDQARGTASPANGGGAVFNDQVPRTTTPNIAFPAQQANPMSMMYQRSMGQVPMMGGNMPMMGMNPMAMAMGMGMNGFNPMGGMNAMNMMNSMNPMSGMSGMGNMGAMRLGMGPMGTGGMGQAGAGMVGMNSMGMGMRPGMTGMGGFNPSLGRMAMNTGSGPARTPRGQHNFHPYSR
jgi:RNA-binding protein Musashi